MGVGGGVELSAGTVQVPGPSATIEQLLEFAGTYNAYEVRPHER